MHANNQYAVNQTSEGVVCVQLMGNWTIDNGLESKNVNAVLTENTQHLKFETDKLGKWDSSLLAFITDCWVICKRRNIAFDQSSLPDGLKRLIKLMATEGEKIEPTTDDRLQGNIIEHVGKWAMNSWQACIETVQYIGEIAISIGRVISGRGHIRFRDILVVIQEASIEALPIVGLIAFLVGFILAFVGAVQLRKFGATIYVADLVGLGMVREMGAMMTAIIMCGRTGAAYAATLGGMKVAEEIDALQTSGLSPIDFLVLPRLLGLFLTMPLLCIFANFIGIIGGLFVCITMLDVSAVEYYNRIVEAISFNDIQVGLIKSTAFGFLVALTGCIRGLRCGTNAEEIGISTTSAVVIGITSLVVADALFSLLFDILQM